MAKIRYTKNELKKQKDNLKRYTRFLPALELKKKQLLQEIRKIQEEMDRIQTKVEQVNQEVGAWADVFAENVDLHDFIKIDQINTETGNIAGIEIPVFQDVIFQDITIDFYQTPLWVDAGISYGKEQIKRNVYLQIAKKQQKILDDELRITIQRIKLFEEVKIPEARENIRIIQIFLGDLQTAEVVRGKIAKSHIERKKQGVGAA